jgi:hypothetical protein
VLAALNEAYLHLVLTLRGVPNSGKAQINKGPTGLAAAVTVDWALVSGTVDRTVAQHVDTACCAAPREGAMTAGCFRWLVVVVVPSITCRLKCTVSTVDVAVMFRMGRDAGVTGVGGITFRSPPRNAANCVMMHLEEPPSVEKRIWRTRLAACATAAGAT